MKRNGLLFIIAMIAVFVAFSFSSAFAETSETLLHPGEWKCDWSVPGFSGTMWITIGSVANKTVKGEIQVSGSSLVGYEKFIGKLEGNTLFIPLYKAQISLVIERGKVIGGTAYGTTNNDINSCFKMK